MLFRSGERAKIRAEHAARGLIGPYGEVKRLMEPSRSGWAKARELGVPAYPFDVAREADKRFAERIREEAAKVEGAHAERGVAVSDLLSALQKGDRAQAKEAYKEAKRFYRERYPDPAEAQRELMDELQKQFKERSVPEWKRAMKEIPKDERGTFMQQLLSKAKQR